MTRYVCVGGPLHEEYLEIPDHVREWLVARVSPSYVMPSATEPLPPMGETIPYERHVYRVEAFQGGPGMRRRYYARYQGVR